MRTVGWRMGGYIPGRWNRIGQGPKLKERMAPSGVESSKEKEDVEKEGPLHMPAKALSRPTRAS